MWENVFEVFLSNAILVITTRNANLVVIFYQCLGFAEKE